MSWGALQSRCWVFAWGVVLAGVLQASLIAHANAQDSIAVVQYTAADLKRATQAIETQLQSSIHLGRLADEKIPELVVPLSGNAELEEVLDLIETSTGERVRLAVRVPKGGVSVQGPLPRLEVLHERGSPQLQVKIKSGFNEARIQGLQVGYFTPDSKGGEQFVPLAIPTISGEGSPTQQPLPSPEISIQLREAQLQAQFALPETGTAIRLESLQPRLDAQNLQLNLKLPETLELRAQQGNSGNIKIRLNERALNLIQTQAELKASEAIVAKVHELGSTQLAQIQKVVQEKVDSLRDQFSVARQLRLPMEAEAAQAAAQLVTQIQSRKPKSSLPLAAESQEALEAKTQGLLVLKELSQSFRLSSPEKFEFMEPDQKQKEGPLYLSSRLALLHSFLANMTQDWDHFVNHSGLNPKNKEDSKQIKKLKELNEDLLYYLSSRGSHAEVARFIEEWGGERGEDSHHRMNQWLQNLAPAIEKFIQNGGLRKPPLAQANRQIHSLLLKAREQKTATLQVDESGTRLRDQLISIQGFLNSAHSSIQMPIPGCDSHALTGSAESLRITSSLRAVNQLSQRLHRDGTLALMLSKQSSITLLEPPVILAGRIDEDSNPKTPPKGLSDGIFTLKSKLKFKQDEFDVELVGRLAPEKNGKAMSLEILEIKSLDHNPGFLESIFPVTLLFKVLPIALFGQSFVDGMLEDKKAAGKNKLVFDLPDSLTQAGFLIQGFEVDPRDLDRMVARVGPGGVGP